MDNKPDLKDLPKIIRQNMKFHLVDSMDEVLKIALTKPLPPKQPPKDRPPEAVVLPVGGPTAAGGGESTPPKEPPLTN
jgi:hypothetical protein